MAGNGIASRFPEVVSRFTITRSTGRALYAKCPAHDDSNSSLTLRLGDNGNLWVKCHVGCSFLDIANAIGCERKDFYVKDGTRMEDKILATYDYRDEQGKTLYQVVRFAPKQFRQRHAQGGGWVWGMNGVRRVLYRLPDIEKNKRRGVVIVEGEKDADRLVSIGLLATTNAMGAGKWQKEYSESLRGRKCIIIPDNDQPGKEHAAAVAESLKDVASFVATIELDGLPEKGDVSDWLDSGHSVDELKQLIQDAMKTGKTEPKPSVSRVRDICDAAKELDRQSLLAAIRGLLNELEIKNLER